MRPRVRVVSARCRSGHRWCETAHRHVEHLLALSERMVTEAVGFRPSVRSDAPARSLADVTMVVQR